MLKRSLLILVLSTSSLGVWGQSAVREPGTSYEAYVSNLKETAPSPYSTARTFKEDNFEGVTPWPMDKLQPWFEMMRNERYLSARRPANFKRRLTWLYPQDGCYARAGAGIKHLIDGGVPGPKKIFAFGDLETKTPYSKRGKVSWWYHVAPVVDVEGRRYVLDPSVEAGHPLTIQEWVTAIADSDDVKFVKVAICEAGAYWPKSKCANTVVGTTGESGVKEYLSAEWDNLVKLGMDPEALLGDAPPW